MSSFELTVENRTINHRLELVTNPDEDVMALYAQHPWDMMVLFGRGEGAESYWGTLMLAEGRPNAAGLYVRVLQFGFS